MSALGCREGELPLLRIFLARVCNKVSDSQHLGLVEAMARLAQQILSHLRIECLRISGQILASVAIDVGADPLLRRSRLTE